MTWQPIETAPRDDVPVLVYDSDDGVIFVAQWNQAVANLYANQREDYGWRSVACSSSFYTGIKVTHWMPLPAPPQVQ